ncbi:hypothetical protein [Mycobacterium lehmannii]|uniref:hypothetical protein n=1 Tax=Mycobacterium lehmannii TaxID=2048550 RepID=UPI000B067648|nr:hypothetical protein [Mycobacterium lehmannii]
MTSGGSSLPMTSEADQAAVVTADNTSAAPDLTLIRTRAGSYTLATDNADALRLFKQITWSSDRRWIHRAHCWLVMDTCDLWRFVDAARARGYRVEVRHG